MLFFRADAELRKFSKGRGKGKKRRDRREQPGNKCLVMALVLAIRRSSTELLIA